MAEVTATESKPVTEGHFGLMLTGPGGIPFPQAVFPRLKPTQPELFLMLSCRLSNPARYNMYGGGRKPEHLSGLQTLGQELHEETGNEEMLAAGETGGLVSWQVHGQVGHPLYAELPKKRDYAFPYLVFHTGGSPLVVTKESQDWARVTASTEAAAKYAAMQPKHGDKNGGAVRYYGGLPYVKGSTSLLGRTEKMIWFGLSLCEIPVAHCPTDEWIGVKEMPFFPMKDVPVSDFIHYHEEHGCLYRKTSSHVTVWKCVPAAPLFDARNIPDVA